jgi:hypothetical protein
MSHIQKTINACDMCGNTKTISKTYVLPAGTTYSLKYFDCKHPRDAKPIEKPKRWAERFGS